MSSFFSAWNFIIIARTSPQPQPIEHVDCGTCNLGTVSGFSLDIRYITTVIHPPMSDRAKQLPIPWINAHLLVKPANRHFRRLSDLSSPFLHSPPCYLYSNARFKLNCSFILLREKKWKLVFTIFIKTLIHLVYRPKFCINIFSISPGYYSRPRRNRRQLLCLFYRFGMQFILHGFAHVSKFVFGHYIHFLCQI